MQVSACCSYRSMPQGYLYQVDGCAPLEAVTGMGVREPVCRDLRTQAYLLGRCLHDPVDLGFIQSHCLLEGDENRAVWILI